MPCSKTLNMLHKNIILLIKHVVAIQSAVENGDVKSYV
jgi:hypothetical protein